MKNDIGIIGLSVMGRNLAFNMADKGFCVAIYNRTTSVADEVASLYGKENLVPRHNVTDFTDGLKKPRRVLLMVKAGEAVDRLIEQLLSHLEEGDIIIDGGNSYFKDTQRRYDYLREKNIHYFGVGVSGGEEGARFGPAIMPGGDREAYESIRPILEAISARVNNIPCCGYTSTGGAGHYVKMVHNGIEYGDMQLISEAYLILKHLGGFSNEELAEIFEAWDRDVLESYLISITADIFRVKDGDGYLVDKILDKASQKGTGRWTTQQAAELGVDISVISSALNARFMSNLKEARMRAENEFPRGAYRRTENKEELKELVKDSLYMAKILSYAQGFALLKKAQEQYGWDFNFADIAKIFREGCIIRARLLQNIIDAYTKNPDLESLLFDDYFRDVIRSKQNSLRKAAVLAIENRLPVPSMISALEYLDVYATAASGANLIQAQRDYFGAHTYERNDMEGSFHYDWVENVGK